MCDTTLRISHLGADCLTNDGVGADPEGWDLRTNDRLHQLSGFLGQITYLV